MPTPRLVDLSNNNGLAAGRAIIQAAGVAAVYAKATEGTGFRDALYPEFRKAAKAHERVFGGYLFLHPGESGQRQAEYFLAYAKPKPGDLEPVVDSEQGSPDAHAAQTTSEALYRLERAGYRPLLYGSTSYLSALHKAVPELGRFRVWQAEYGPTLHRVPGLNAVAWQFTDRAVIGKGRLRADGDRLLVRDLAAIRIPAPVKPPVQRRPPFGRI